MRTVLIVTNRHIAVPNPTQIPAGIVNEGAKPSLEVVHLRGYSAGRTAHGVCLLRGCLAIGTSRAN
jgi:hypothetical protein